MYGMPNFIQSARETYLGDYATKKRTPATEEDLFQMQNEEDTQFEDKFADSVKEVETLVEGLEKETNDVLSNNTKTQLKEKISSLLSQLNKIDERLVLSKRTHNPNAYYERFRQLLINKVKSECGEDVNEETIREMESFIKMSYAPIKMMIETILDEPEKIEELFQRIENNENEEILPSFTKPKSQLIEVPAQIDDTVHLQMTEEKAQTSSKGSKGKKVSTNDPVMGE